MATYVGDLVDEVRRDTENVENSATTGISTDDFLRYMNYGLQRIQARLVQNNATIFRKSHDFTISNGVSAYTIPDNVYLRESIVNVQYSRDGQEQNFRDLPEIGESYRVTETGGYVKAYTRRAGSILLSPSPGADANGGILRVVYEKAIDRLDIRRGQVDDITVAGGSVSANTVSLNTSTDDETKIAERTPGDFCIVGVDGTPKTYNVPFTAYATGTGDFTHSAQTVVDGQTPAVNDYVTLGKYTSTHLHLLDSPDLERYVQLYCAVKIFRRDSSNDATEAARELSAVEREIVETYGQIQKDEGVIQISNSDILRLESW